MKTAPNIIMVFAEAKHAIIAKTHHSGVMSHTSKHNNYTFGTYKPQSLGAFAHNRKFRLNENRPQHNSGFR